jgi:heme/copper-type cytochrome/quinol oxidase subunit 3
MEASSRPIQPEPIEWQPRALWVSARLLCGAISFFFMAFLFGYFYLRLLNTNHAWKIGTVSPQIGLGAGVAACVVLSAVLFRMGIHRPAADTLSTGIVAIILGLVAVVLQCVQYASLGFGPASGGYASIFIGWTSTYAVMTLLGLIWIETQTATLWRARRAGADEDPLLRAGLEAASFYWAYFAVIGAIAFIILYLA